MEQGNVVTGERISGTVKWFSNEKKFGFITGDDGKDRLVHWTAIVSNHDYKMLHEQERVTFVSEETPRGLKAHQVKLIPQQGSVATGGIDGK